jgi:membrane-bound metal-dependent hydrolase YbcI (DUF457 family)
MTLPTHLMAGLILGKITGNYPLSIGIGVGIDVDHVFSYFKNGILLKPKKFLKTIFNKDDPYGDQRFILHNVLVFILLSMIVLMFNRTIGVVFALAYFSHIFLDALDSSDYFPFFPNKKLNLHGPIKYFSKQEFTVFLLLIVVFFLL